MTILEKKAAREAAITEMKELNKIENRSLTSEETTKYNGAKSKVEKLTREIETAEIENRSAQPPHQPNQPKGGQENEICFRSLLQNAMANPATEVQIPTMGKIAGVENRSMTAGGNQGTLVDTQIFNLEDELTEELVFGKMGLDFMGGIKGNISIPVIGDTIATFKGENAKADELDLAIRDLKLSPRRITGIMNVSNRLLEQDTVGFNAKMRTKIIQSVARGIENRFFSKSIRTEDAPAGVLALIGNPLAEAGIIDHKATVALEGSLRSSNGLKGNLSYITSAKGVELTKCIEKMQNRFIYDESGTINTYPVIDSNFLPEDLGAGSNEFAMVFGDWSRVQMRQWGENLTLKVNPYNKMDENITQFYVSIDIDWALTHKKSFAYSTFLPQYTKA